MHKEYSFSKQSDSFYAPQILIVDDVAANIQLLAHALEGEYRVKFATSGFDVLTLINEDYKPDLILLDVMMPDMDGYEVCRKIHSMPDASDIPVIFVTAKHGVEDQIQGFACGCVDYITKPFDLSVVRARVRKHVKDKLNLEAITLLDPVTKLPNRRQMDNMLNSEWLRAIRNHSEISLLLIDVDYFKKYNDCYGRAAGDECLKRIAKTLQDECYRTGDLVARYGGDEFAVILPESDEFSVQRVAKRLSSAVESLDIPHLNSTFHHVTISIGGVSMLPILLQNKETLLLEVDKALHQAKEAGANHLITTSALQGKSAQKILQSFRA